MKKMGIVIHGKLHIKIQNIVASVILGGKVDLEGFYEAGGKIGLGGKMMYEPEQFPGVIYRMENPKLGMNVVAIGAKHARYEKKQDIYQNKIGES